MLSHEPQTIEQSIENGLTRTEAWLRELVLVVTLKDTQEYNGDICFDGMILNDGEEGMEFPLDVITTEGYKVEDGFYQLRMYFECRLEELKSAFGEGSHLDGFNEELDIEGFLKTVTEMPELTISYNLEADADCDTISLISSSALYHTQDEQFRLEVKLTEG
ncbi:hypothetical protein VCHA53O466_140109 [Vibrio chagasii]|nr:hypothetical protein VCHA53O466_140109 [Vibrio chagasii]